MATFKFTGLENYMAQLKKLEADTDKIIGKAVYEAAKMVADDVRANMEKIPVISNAEAKEYHKTHKHRQGISQKQKEGLLEGFGISAMQDDNGFVNVKLGFDGRNGVKTKQNPEGQANIVIARAVESGSSYMQKHPFVRPATTSAKKKAAEEKMQAIIDQEISEIMK